MDTIISDLWNKWILWNKAGLNLWLDSVDLTYKLWFAKYEYLVEQYEKDKTRKINPGEQPDL